MLPPFPANFTLGDRFVRKRPASVIARRHGPGAGFALDDTVPPDRTAGREA
jgi:hypothetical protein